MFLLLAFHKSALIKRSSPSEKSISIQNAMVPRWLVQVLHPRQKFQYPTIAIKKKKKKERKLMIQIKLLGTSMTFHCNKLSLPKCKYSLVFSIKKMRILKVNLQP
jgi:hypothetical protein